MTTPMVTTSSASGTWTDVTVSTYESVRIYYHAKLIENAQPQILHGRFAGEKVNVPVGYGGAITFHNFGNIDTIVANYTLIDNGDPGTAVTLAISEKTTSLPLYGRPA